MSPQRWNRRGLLGLGVGLTAAGAATAAGLAADRLWRAREHAVALGATGEYDEVPDSEVVVVAEDGVPLHVEIDEPRGEAVPLGPADAGNDDGDDDGDDGPAPAPTVVLSHGYTLDRRSWVFQRRALREAGYRVVLWEQRGHGLSGAASHESYDIDQLGRDLERVITEVVPEGPLVLVGHSMGAMTMMALAEHRPELIAERVVGAGFVATSAGGLFGTEWGLGARLGQLVHRVGPHVLSQLAGRQELVDSALRTGQEVEEFFVQRYSFASPVPLGIVRLTADMIFGTRMEVISAYLSTLGRHDKVEALAHFVGVETLVLNGAKDLLTAPKHSAEIVRHLPGAEHVLVNEAGHILMLEHPETVNEQLLSLVQRARRGERRRGQGGTTPVPRTVTNLQKRRRDERARSRLRRRQHAS